MTESHYSMVTGRRTNPEPLPYIVRGVMPVRLIERPAGLERSAEPKREDPPIEFYPADPARHVLHFENGGPQLEEQFSTITSYVRRAVRAGVETGGFLWTDTRPSTSKTKVARVTGPAPTARHSQAEIRLGNPLEVEDADGLLPCGDWHHHPSPRRLSGLPSPADQRAWAGASKWVGRPWVGLIVHRQHEIDGWSNPCISAWVTTRDPAIGRYVVRRAEIRRER